MKNVEITQNGQTLIIKVDLTKRFGTSKSGKSTIIASTDGNMSLPDNESIKIGLNVYTK